MPSRLALALPLVASLACPALGWQVAPAGAPTQPAATDSPSFGPILSVDFAGGTTEEYIKALRKASSEPINVILSREAASVPLAPFSLASVSLDIAIQAIQPAAGEEVGVFRIRRIAPLTPAPANQAGAATYAVDFMGERSITARVSRSAAGTPSPVEPLSLAVFSLREMTDPGDDRAAAARTETILTAVEAALELAASNGDDPAPEVKFHADSGLLIVRGTTRQRAAVDDCITALSRDVERRRRDLRESRVSPEQLIELRAQLTRKQLEAEQREAEAALTARRLQEMKLRVDAGVVSQDEFRALELERAKAASSMEIAKVDLARARDMLALWETRAGAVNGPVVADLSAWSQPQYDQAVRVLTTLYDGAKNSLKLSPLSDKARTLALAGDPPQIESAVTLLREFARAHGIAEPALRSADGDAMPAGR